MWVWECGRAYMKYMCDSNSGVTDRLVYILSVWQWIYCRWLERLLRRYYLYSPEAGYLQEGRGRIPLRLKILESLHCCILLDNKCVSLDCWADNHRVWWDIQSDWLVDIHRAYRTKEQIYRKRWTSHSLLHNTGQQMYWILLILLNYQDKNKTIVLYMD